MGSMADLVGNRKINLSGCFLLGLNTLACGLARTGLQLVIFRTFQGIVVSMCLPTAFSILTEVFSSGKRRNVGFACLGLGQPLGFSFGLVLGGVFEESPVGWRFGYYLCAGVTTALAAVNWLWLPQDRRREQLSWNRLANKIDWIGVILSSAGFGLFSYVFAYVHLNQSCSPRWHPSLTKARYTG